MATDPTPTPDVYEAAARAYDATLAGQLRVVHGFALGPEARTELAEHPAFRAAVDAAVAATRAQREPNRVRTIVEWPDGSTFIGPWEPVPDPAPETLTTQGAPE